MANNQEFTKTREKSWRWVGNAVAFLEKGRLRTGIAEAEKKTESPWKQTEPQ